MTRSASRTWKTRTTADLSDPSCTLVVMVTELSWRLKIRRAEEHFNELQKLVEAYQAGHHYRAVCPNPPTKKPTHWRFVLEITEPPDPSIAIVLGDCLYNIHSALDHIAVACAPRDRRHQAGFPIVVNPNDAEQMRKYDSQTRGMDPQAVAAIEFEQPHNVAKRAQPGPHSVDALFTLSALQNADKHRSLAVLVPGLYLPTAWAFWDDEAIGITQPAYLEAGADVMRWDEFGNQIRYEDVPVEVKGTSVVSVIVAGRPDPYELLPLAGGILARVRDRIIPNLEPYARS
jgi:hypothetical protein